MSEGGKRVMEVDDFSQLKGCSWPDFWAETGNAEAANAVETARQGGVARFKGPANTAKGTPRYWDVQVSAIVGADGKPSHLLSISRDITEEWRAAKALAEAHERQTVLAEELQHRVKNTLAMVGAIANQTMRGNDVESARQAFNARLLALGRAHDILTRTRWTGAPIAEVVEGALAPHRTGEGRIKVDGPDLQLNAKQSLALALALHELATNATKHGALSNERGTVRITWSIDPIAAAPTFMLRWAEAGGPPVQEPLPNRKGFGSRLIERVLTRDFGGQIGVVYAPTGVVCELTASLPEPSGTPG
jgi:two-component sensor histidine kinase